MLPTPTRTFVRPLERNGDAVGSRDELPVNPLRKCQDNELLICAGTRGRGWAGMPAADGQSEEAKDGRCPSREGKTRETSRGTRLEGENNGHARAYKK